MTVSVYSLLKTRVTLKNKSPYKPRKFLNLFFIEKRDFTNRLADIKIGKKNSKFDARTDSTSATQYFQFYALLSQQQNMMQDYIRTATYQKAILDNSVDFEGKVVLDVGAGSGILSFFAVHAGASKVYAVEASSMAQHANVNILTWTDLFFCQ